MLLVKDGPGAALSRQALRALMLGPCWAQQGSSCARIGISFKIASQARALDAAVPPPMVCAAARAACLCARSTRVERAPPLAKHTDLALFQLFRSIRRTPVSKQCT